MKPQLDANYTVTAYCPFCKVVVHFGTAHQMIQDRQSSFQDHTFNRVCYATLTCSRCHRAGLATILDNGSPQTAALESFFPVSPDQLPLPAGVPPDITAEFREAELCSAYGAHRAASALFRSVLEKTLKANGYIKGNDKSLTDLQKRIDAAASDGVITDARKRRAHAEIRSLGNDVLHDDWRVVTAGEVEEAHKYMQRILEDLYDDRSTVEAILTAKQRLPLPPSNP